MSLGIFDSFYHLFFFFTLRFFSLPLPATCHSGFMKRCSHVASQFHPSGRDIDSKIELSLIIQS